MYSLGTRLGYEWGHFQEYASSPGQNEKTTGQGDVGGEVRWEGDAHDAHARITASGRIGSARRARLCRPAPSLRVVASRPVLPQAAVPIGIGRLRLDPCCYKQQRILSGPGLFGSCYFFS